MFSGITSYIFGASTSSQEEEVPVNTETSGNHDDHPDEAKLRLRTSAEDNEWVLVDRTSGMNSSMEGSQISTTSVPPSDLRERDQCALQSDIISRSVQELSRSCQEGSSSRGSSGMSSPVHVLHPSLGESWLVTPPPCFTAGGDVGDLEQNPLEDLLIEHPSMSVYGPRGRPHSTGHDSEDSVTSSTENVTPASRGQHAGRGVVPRHRARPMVTSAKAGLQAQVAATRAVQRAQKWHDNKHHARHALERNNRVRHHNSHTRRQRRKDHMLHPSGRSNDRKMAH